MAYANATRRALLRWKNTQNMVLIMGQLARVGVEADWPDSGYGARRPVTGSSVCAQVALFVDRQACSARRDDVHAHRPRPANLRRSANPPSRRSPPSRACRACAARADSASPTGRSSCAGSSAASRTSSSRTSATSRSSPSSRSPTRRRSSTYRVRDPRPQPGRQLLLLPRLRHQHPRHLQAHRVHAGHAGAQARRHGRARSAASSRRTARSTCSTAPRARCASGPAATVPPSWPALAAALLRRRRALLPEAFAPLRDVPAPRPARSTTSCAATTTSSAFIAEVRDAEHRRRSVDEALPARHPQRRASRTCSRSPLYDYQREGALFAARAGRCLIGDEMGLGKTIQAIAAAEIMARTVRRRARADRLPDVAQAPVAARDRDASPAATVAGRRRPARPRASSSFAADAFFKITNYDTVHRDLDLIDALGARPGHPRRGPAHQELEHARRPQRQAASTRPTPSS